MSDNIKHIKSKILDRGREDQQIYKSSVLEKSPNAEQCYIALLWSLISSISDFLLMAFFFF